MGLTGRVMSSCGGFYQVSLDKNRYIECKCRGKLKGLKEEVFPGDLVNVDPINEREGIITGILPRKILLKRPYVANADKAFLVFALATPEPSLVLIDRFLLLMEEAGLSITLVFNKQDLVKPSVVKKWVEHYRRAGYDVISSSALKGIGKRKIMQRMAGHISVFAGPSGVGKSALLNLCGSWGLATGDLSLKIQRGKHTTRVVRLLPVKDKGFVFDTPGFTQLDLSHIEPEKLGDYFPDFREVEKQCRFIGCQHRSEPGCSIKEAVEGGMILPERYRNYLLFWDEIMSQRRKRY